jgi:hypothetical protein
MEKGPFSACCTCFVLIRKKSRIASIRFDNKKEERGDASMATAATALEKTTYRAVSPFKFPPTLSARQEEELR